MKKLLVVLLLIILPLKVSALTASVSLSCPSSGTVGSTLTCTIKGNATTGSVSSLSAKISLSSNLQFVSFTPSSIWQGDGINGAIDLYTDSNKTGAFNIGTFTFKIKSTGTSTITLGNIKLYDASFNEKTLSSISKTIKILSSVNTLSSLNISQGTLSPSFSSNTLTYSANVDSTTITISATKTDSKSSLSGDIGSKALQYGLNKLYVKVKSEAGVTKTYTLNITRKDPRSANSYLSELSISGKKITLGNGKLIYNMTVDETINDVTIGAKVSDSKSTIVGTGKYNIENGKNTFKVTVTAENGTKSIYTINIYKKVTYDILTDFNDIINNAKVVTNDNIKILEAINGDSDNILVKVMKSELDKIVPSNVLDSLIENQKILSYQIINNNIPLYTIIIDGSKLTNATGYIDLDLVFNETDKTLSFAKKQVLQGTIGVIIYTNTFVNQDKVYLYDSKNLVNQIKPNNDSIVLEVNRLDNYTLRNKMVNNFTFDYKILSYILMSVIIVLIFVIFVLIKKNRPKENISQI